MTLVDTNVVLDLPTEDSEWADWSEAALDRAASQGPLLINDVIYAECSIRYERLEDLDEFLDGAGFEHVPIPRAALFLTGKIFNRYRKAGGTRTGVLPDFFIGAHAAVSEIPLLTRDVRRYRNYFPSIELITPAMG